jgi:hypothetical protein
MIFTKRKKFFLSSVVLAWALLMIQFVPLTYRYVVIAGLGLVAYLLSVWSLHEDLDGIEWFVNLILPTLFLPSVALFYFLVPPNLPVRLIIFGLAALGQYGLLLSANIFSVAVIRTIQLLRAAQAITFLFTLMIAFFLFDTIYSFKLMPYVIAPLVTLTSWPLILQSLWSVRLEKKTILVLVIASLLLSILFGQLGFLISLWPVNIVIASLFLVSGLYLSLSLLQYDLNGRLFKETVQEYVRLGILLFLLTYLTARWG